MSGVYLINEDGTPQSINRIRCKNEGEELQDMLDRNLDLLPGEQIDPDNPRRWFLIKREMPVPDPNTGGNRWSIDFFLADQDGIPTFVECKRFADMRSRREVVGQMLEYAANGHFYWTADILRKYAEESCQAKGLNMEECLLSFMSDNGDLSDQFFDRIQLNLREGQVRLIFFLEDSPFELRSVVDFLNKQMERSEVLLVEARQYLTSNVRIVVPTLFGYTEQARLVKKTIVVKPPLQRRSWDKESFFNDARAKVNEAEIKNIDWFYDQCLKLGLEIGWGTGAVSGSFSVYERSICPRSFLSVWSYGSLALNFGWLNGSGRAEEARDRFIELLKEKGFQVPLGLKYPNLKAIDWTDKVKNLIDILSQLMNEFKKLPN